MSKATNFKPPVIPKKYFFSFCIVTVLFALWGFANNFTDPLVSVFKDVFVINNAQSSWVQMAFYGGYATMAIVGAVWLTGFQGKILDMDSFMGTSATRGSFYLTVGCFIIIAIYGFLCKNPRKRA